METSGKGQNPLSLNPEIVRQVLVQFIRDEITNAGFSKAVMGLSGGVDSSLVAYLASEALGAKNLLGVFMPYKTSSAESLADGRLVADQLEISTETVDISPMVDVYAERSNGEMNNVRKGN